MRGVHHRIVPRLSPGLLFPVLTASLCTAVLATLASPGYQAAPQVVGPALAVDLALGLPLVGYLTLVRRGGQSGWVLLPLLVAGLLLAEWWIPRGHLAALPPLPVLAGAAEGALLVVLGIRIRRILSRWRVHRRTLQPLVATRRALADVLGPRAGGILFVEFAVLWYAVAGWRRAPSPGDPTFSLHRRSAYPAVVGAILLVLAAETSALHLVLAGWSPVAAWILTGLSVYSGLWLLGDLHAARLNPVTAGPWALEVTVGVRSHASLPWSQIRAVGRQVPEGEPSPSPGNAMAEPVFLGLWGSPNLWIEMDREVEVDGLLDVASGPASWRWVWTTRRRWRSSSFSEWGRPRRRSPRGTRTAVPATIVLCAAKYLALDLPERMPGPSTTSAQGAPPCPRPGPPPTYPAPCWTSWPSRPWSSSSRSPSG